MKFLIDKAQIDSRTKSKCTNANMIFLLKLFKPKGTNVYMVIFKRHKWLEGGTNIYEELIEEAHKSSFQTCYINIYFF